MKSFTKIALVAAIAVISTVGFTSCKKDKDNNAPEYKGEMVKTQFSLNLPSKVGGMRKMPGATVQADGEDFRGIEGIRLIPYTVTLSGSNDTPVPHDASALTNMFTLTNIDGWSDDTGNKHAKVYNDVQIPIGTNAFLFYGKAIDATAGKDIATDASYDNATKDALCHQYGYLQKSNFADPIVLDNVIFDYKKIYGSATNDKANAIAAYLTAVANANITTPSAKAWSGMVSNDVRLGTLYNAFITLQAGSSFNVKRTLEDLYKQMLAYKALDAQAAQNKDIADAIIAAIETKATWDNTNEELTLDASVDGYPAEIYLPDGAAAVAWQTNQFVAVSATFTGKGGALDVPSIAKYVYPASLYYFVNSKLRAADAIKSDRYSSKNSWDAVITDLYANGENGAAAYDDVRVTSRSIAITKQIQYAVARLRTNVKAAETALKQHSYIDPATSTAYTSETAATVDASKLKVTAVFVGAINRAGWNFAPYTEASGDPAISNVIYDPTTSPIALTGEYQEVNNTLVLESREGTAINIAIELVNDDKDFHGVDGQVVPKGGHFYLVGQLDPALVTDAAKNHGLNTTFIQDYATIARLSIGDLTKAYNVIPDLRVPQLELGLSVNLEWQQGMEFDVVL